MKPKAKKEFDYGTCKTVGIFSYFNEKCRTCPHRHTIIDGSYQSKYVLCDNNKCNIYKKTKE